MSFERFEFLEIGDQQPRAVDSGPTVTPPRTESQAVAPTGRLVADQIIGSRGTEIGRFNCPAGLAVDIRGNLYVADSYNHRIQIISPDGRAVAFGQKGTSPGCFLNPQDVVVDRNFAIYVLEQGNCRIQKIGVDGRLEYIFGRKGSRPGEFSSPMGIAVDRFGGVFVADTGNRRVQKLNSSGMPVDVFGATERCRLHGPQGVDVDGAGSCYIADAFLHCVVGIDINGREISRIGCRGVGPGQFGEPQDLARDQHGYLYIIEMENNRLQVLGGDGRCLACFEGSEGAVGRMESPTGVAIGPAGEVFIADTMNHRIIKVAWT